MGKVFFHYADKKVRIYNTTAIKQFIKKIFQKESIEFTRIDFIFCSDKYILPINRKFLHHDYYTDIISFPIKHDPLTGEIYISIERVKINSKEYKVQFKEELLRVIFHGALHFCGYADNTQRESELMRFMENKYLSFFFCFLLYIASLFLSMVI